MEMLSVIAVIGIISAIAIPNIGRINESARVAAGKRNAQNIVSIYQSAQAAGLDFTQGNVFLTTLNVMQGDIVEGGVFDGTYFGMPGGITSNEDLWAALCYLELQNNSLVYLGEGNGEDPLNVPDIFENLYLY